MDTLVVGAIYIPFLFNMISNEAPLSTETIWKLSREVHKMFIQDPLYDHGTD